MPELKALTDKLRGQLDDLKVPNRITANGDPGQVLLELQLSLDTAQVLSRALEGHHAELTEAEEEWEAVSAAASKIEGFTGGEASE
jgi:hypothetical protein